MRITGYVWSVSIVIFTSMTKLNILNDFFSVARASDLFTIER